MEHRLLAAHRADRGQLVDLFGERHQRRKRLEWPAVERHVEPGDDDDQPAIREAADDRHEPGPEELRLVDRDDVGAVRDGPFDVLGRCHREGGHAEPDVRGQPIGALPRVEGVAEHRDLPAGDQRATDAPQQLLGLAREHRAAHHLDPPDRAHAQSMAPHRVSTSKPRRR